MEHMVGDEQMAEQGEIYPMWQPTQWTARQRTLAIRGLLLIAAAGALLAGAVARWRAQPLAVSTIAPLGATLLSLGVGLLNAVFWYAYEHGQNSVGERARQATIMVRVTSGEIVVALGTLGLQVIGALLVATVGWPGWKGYSPYSYVVPVGLCLTVNLANFVLWSVITWRPTRDPNAPMYTLSAPLYGARLFLRWVVMGFARTSVLLLIPPLFALSNGDLQLSNGSADALVALLPGVAEAPVSVAVAVFGAAAAFFLLAALAELSHPA